MDCWTESSAHSKAYFAIRREKESTAVWREISTTCPTVNARRPLPINQSTDEATAGAALYTSPTSARRTSLSFSSAPTSLSLSPESSPRPVRQRPKSVTWLVKPDSKERANDFALMSAEEVREAQRRMRAKHTEKSISRRCLAANRRFMLVYATPPCAKGSATGKSAMQDLGYDRDTAGFMMESS